MDGPKPAFGDLPPEICLLIAKHTRSRRALGSLSRVNRYFHQIFNPCLYQYNVRRRRGCSALVWAARFNREATARIALEYQTPLRQTAPLVVAAVSGHDRIVELLLAKDGVNIEATLPDKYTPLELAVREGHEAVVKLLLDAGANLEPRKTRFETLCGDGPLLFQAVKGGHPGVVRRLVECGGVDVNEEARVGGTALVLAVRLGKPEIVKCLLVAGADPNVTSPWGTPIHSAIYGNRAEIVRIFVECDEVDINLVPGLGDTPLSYAITKPPLAELLLRRKDLDVNTKLPFEKAINRGEVDLAKALLATNRLNQKSRLEGLLTAIRLNLESTNSLIPLIVASGLVYDDKVEKYSFEYLLRRARDVGNTAATKALRRQETGGSTRLTRWAQRLRRSGHSVFEGAFG
ncbi:ankyrin repeat-containing domain protein [Aspergillus lucknowensis]|uniref:Ankyrin repeat-containing domain protein n=1 Tax=Aspergillus lucknowensis TaxID=176173 RepID=A0ABR4LYR5_9EURO